MQRRAANDIPTVPAEEELIRSQIRDNQLPFRKAIVLDLHGESCLNGVDELLIYTGFSVEMPNLADSNLNAPFHSAKLLPQWCGQIRFKFQCRIVGRLKE